MPENENGVSPKKIVGLVVLILVIFLLVALPQWILLCLYATDHLVYTLTCFCVAFLLLTCMHLFEALKYKRPWNYIVLAVCYELMTLGAASFLMEWDITLTFIVLGVAFLFLVLFLLLSLLLIVLDKYPNPFNIAIVGSMCFVLAFFFEVVDVVKEWCFWRDLAVTVFLISVILILVSHVLITADNFEVLVEDDAMIVAFVVYITYLLFLIGGRISVNCIQHNRKHHW
ncbi:uncharacterized protein Dana_GF15543 [Drosophila ananassae]|uniref:Uncharacterized protein n=1 Tax=Drosophila ananassae TaxID=7217 RepID=B3MLZ5_DROAN|nr:uncharacterized protein LOC6498351 [Drosophila ananassae]EDV31823.1 uncharacterized protein Dana_GF15543 [Drosophila ananassae]